MSDYYIRTPDNEASRGPFDIPKLQTLAEAGQVSENTLFYDESREEWIPIGLSTELKDQVFPPREKLALKIAREGERRVTDDERDQDDAKKQSRIDVESMLAAAEGETSDTKHLKKRSKSIGKAAAVACSGLGMAFFLSALCLALPHYAAISEMIDKEHYYGVLNFPFLVIGVFDLILAILLLLAVSETFPVLRGRAMITLGFGLYVGWVLNDTYLMGACAVSGVGIFAATMARSFPTMVTALLFAIGGNAYLAYLAYSGRFSGFFEIAKLPLITQ